MLSDVFNAAFAVLSAFSTGSSSDETSSSCSSSDDEREGRNAVCPSTTPTTTAGGQKIALEKDHDPLGTTGLLNQLLLVDEQITRSIAFFAHPKTKPQRIIKRCCQVLEISGHGVPWFSLSGLLLALYFTTAENRTFFDYGLNMLVLLIVDILLVAPLKLLFKRPRPSMNIGRIPMSVSSVDSYAFPSGHASRCIALAAYFCYMPPFNPWTHLWYIWALLVSLSRVALGRHHVSDVGAGAVAGLCIFDVVRRLVL